MPRVKISVWRILVIFLLMINFAIASQERVLLAPDVQLGMRSNIINPISPHLVFSNKDAAKAWLSDMSNRLKTWVPDDFLRTRYLTIIQYEATRAGLDPQLILSLITVESHFNKYAISGSGARGMMQVMPFWLSQIGTPDQDLFDLETNIRYGCTILRYYSQIEHGNIRNALARYNGSLGSNTYPDLVMSAYNRYWAPYTVITMKDSKVKYIDYTN